MTSPNPPATGKIRLALPQIIPDWWGPFTGVDIMHAQTGIKPCPCIGSKTDFGWYDTGVYLILVGTRDGRTQSARACKARHGTGKKLPSLPFSLFVFHSLFVLLLLLLLLPLLSNKTNLRTVQCLFLCKP